MTEEFDFGSLIEKEEPVELEKPNEIIKREKPVKIQIKERLSISKRKPLHVLTEDNLTHFFKEKEKTKLYEMKIRFYDNSLKEIDDMVQSLFKKGLLKRDKNNWISLRQRKNNA